MPEPPFERMQLGSASVCATHPSLSLAFREYFQLSEKLNPRAFTVFIANSNTERRRWYRLHKRIIELSLYTKCHVLLVDDETGRTLGTLTSEELQGFARVWHHHAVLAIVSHRHVCRLCRSYQEFNSRKRVLHSVHEPSGSSDNLECDVDSVSRMRSVMAQILAMESAEVRRESLCAAWIEH